MRKKTILLYIVSITSFILIQAPIFPAQSSNLLKCEFYIDLNWDFVGFGGTSPYSWIGYVEGDINGDLYVALTGATFPAPGVELFTEDWGILTEHGWINGTNKGKWTMANYKWVANGEVTYACNEYAHLVGSRFQYRGTTTEFPVDPPTPVSGTGILHITHDK
jgi:hypothetical protein